MEAGNYPAEGRDRWLSAGAVAAYGPSLTGDYVAVAEDQAAGLRAQVTASVRHQISRYAANLATVVQSNPHGSILTLLHRPDVAHSLADSLAQAKAQALSAVQQAAPSSTTLLGFLTQDIERAYNEAPGRIQEAAIRAWHSVPQQNFIPGVTTPGTNPVFETATRRAQAVRRALEGQADALAMRNSLSVHQAAAGGATEALIEGAAAGSLKRWVASMDGKDPRSCVWCRALHGTVIPLGEEFSHGAPAQGKHHEIAPPAVYRGRLTGPPRHPNCLPGDARVLAKGITGATARVFDGELVVISTLSDKHLRVTPNHPVLTSHGWKRAGDITEVDYVVSTAGQQRQFASDQQDQHMQSTIQEVAEAFLGSGAVTASEVPTSAEDFHGDGAGSEVSVVGTYGGLLAELQAALAEHLCYQDLPGTDPELPLLVHLCPEHQRLAGVALATSGSMGSGSPGLPLGGSVPGRANALLLSDAPDRDSLTDQELGEGHARDALVFGQRLDTFAGQVALDQVVRVSREPFTGHVYNLQTRSGWYIGNNIIVHNCRCVLEIVLLEPDTEPITKPVPVPEPEDMISSDDIADMPEDRYQSLRHFIASAIHELGQLIRAMLGIGTS
jgi:hypothetical protein